MPRKVPDVRLDDEFDVIVERLEQRFTETYSRHDQAEALRSEHEVARRAAKRFLPLLAEQRARRVLSGRRLR